MMNNDDLDDYAKALNDLSLEELVWLTVRGVIVRIAALLGALFLAVALLGCVSSHALYERESRLPMECRYLNGMTLDQARHRAGELLAGVPVRIEVTDGTRLHAHRDDVLGLYSITLPSDRISGMWLAHELAHIAVFEAYGAEAPLKEHGPAFVRAYKLFLRELVSEQCSELL